MAGEKGGKPFEMRVTDIEDPLPDATFGSIGRYVEVALPDQRDEPIVPQRLTLGFDEKQAAHVDPWTLMLFRVELESRTFTPVESSRVNASQREVTAWVNQPGTYGLIGLPKHKAILETLRLFDRFGPQLLEERERGEHGLHDRICGLILCADPNPWGDEPLGPGNLCTKCLGLDLSYGLRPERYLLERHADISTFREHVDEETCGRAIVARMGRQPLRRTRRRLQGEAEHTCMGGAEADDEEGPWRVRLDGRAQHRRHRLVMGSSRGLGGR